MRNLTDPRFLDSQDEKNKTEATSKINCMGREERRPREGGVCVWGGGGGQVTMHSIFAFAFSIALRGILSETDVLFNLMNETSFQFQ